MHEVTPLAVFAASLLGSVHCAAMCGGIAGLCSTGSNPLRGTIWYHLARGASYVLLGAAAGFAGRSLDLAGSLVGFQRISILLTAGILLLYGIHLFRAPRGEPVKIGADSKSGAIWRWAFSTARKPHGAGVIGFLTGFLPCGWLWLFLAAAAGTGSIGQGAVVMFAFWLGTIPILLGAGGLGKLISSRLVVPSRIAAGVILISAGVYSFSLHLMVDGKHSHHHQHQMKHDH